MVSLVLACFFFSGASGLLFEVLWTRELGLVFGSTTLAIATVLSAFMGGLALGSYLCGRLVDRLADPLAAYALVEGGIGLYALGVPLSLSAYPALYQGIFRALPEQPLLASLLRFLGSALLLLPPTTLMGATLPLLTHFLVRERGARSVAGATGAIGTLFALNTCGAVLGTFLSGFVLLPHLGVRATNLVAALTNLSLCAAVLGHRWLHGRLAPAFGEEAAASPFDSGPAALRSDGRPESPAPDAASPLQRRLALYAYGISGATAMMYQVLWTRALAIVLGSSIYSFTLILLAFLIGLGGGAAAAVRLCARLRRPVLALGLCHLLVLVLALASYSSIDKLPAAFLWLLRGGDQMGGVDGLLWTQFLLAALPILPVTLALGAVLPLTMRIYGTRAEGAGREVGQAYALNTLGAIVGSFAAGFVVLPGLGLQRGLLLCALLTALLAATLLFVSERPRLGRSLSVLALGMLVLGALGLPRWNLSHFSAGLFRVSIASDIIKNDRWPVPQLLYYKDGIATTVSVEKWGRTLALKNNGKVDASNSDDMATQIRVGLLPLLVHPRALDRPPEVAVIGYGSGVTIGAVTRFPIGHADVVELEPAVVEAGDRFFAEYSHRPSRDPRVRVVIGDGRNFLLAAELPKRYDVIVSEPSNPWITGVSSLFTTDYWRLARRRLKDDGVFCQWAQLYELSQRNIKTLLRSFAAVFPYTYVLSAEDLSSDVILLASPRPLPLDLSRLARNFAVRSVAEELRRGGIEDPEDLLAGLLLTPDEVPALTQGAPLNTDDNALIEFAAPRDLFDYRKHDPYIRRIYGDEWPYGRFLPYLQNAGGAGSGTYARLGRALLRHGKRSAALRLLPLARGGSEDLRRLLDLFAERDAYDDEAPLRGPAPPPAGWPAGTGAKERRQYAAFVGFLNEKKWAHALRAIKSWPERQVESMGPDFLLRLGFLLYKTGFADNAVDRLRPLLLDEPFLRAHPELLYYLARAEYENGMPRRAVEHMERFLKVDDWRPDPGKK